MQETREGRGLYETAGGEWKVFGDAQREGLSSHMINVASRKEREGRGKQGEEEGQKGEYGKRWDAQDWMLFSPNTPEQISKNQGLVADLGPTTSPPFLPFPLRICAALYYTHHVHLDVAEPHPSKTDCLVAIGPASAPLLRHTSPAMPLRHCVLEAPTFALNH